MLALGKIKLRKISLRAKDGLWPHRCRQKCPMLTNNGLFHGRILGEQQQTWQATGNQILCDEIKETEYVIL